MVSLIIVFALSMPFSSTRAATIDMQFGGQVIFSLPCTCGSNIWILYIPLWLGSTPSIGALVYTPGSSTLHENYNISSIGGWHLGGYQSNAQCEFYIYTGCYQLPAEGTISYVGTS
jgi:hypothetical protein